MAGKARHQAYIVAGVEAVHSHLYPHTGNVEREQEVRLA